VAFSENARDFWVAAAAAAPVIALAGLFSLTDAAVAGDVLKRAKSENPELRGVVTRGVQLVGPPNGWVIIYGILNLVMQGFVLIVALLALLHDATPVPGIWVIVVEGAGLLFLLLAAMLAGQVGGARQRVEEALTRAAAEQLAEAIASKLGQLALKPQETLTADGPKKPKRTGDTAAPPDPGPGAVSHD
jgi:hypothetical protein